MKNCILAFAPRLYTTKKGKGKEKAGSARKRKKKKASKGKKKELHTFDLLIIALKRSYIILIKYFIHLMKVYIIMW